MNINPKELQKFYDAWAPVIASLPAVINAAERSNEITSHIAQKEAEYKALDEKCILRETVAEASIKAALERTNEAKAKHAEALAAMDAEIKAAKADVRKAKSDSAAKVAEYQAAADQAYQAVVKARENNEKALAELSVTYSTRQAELESEILALEAKRDEVKRVIADLRAQLVG